MPWIFSLIGQVKHVANGFWIGFSFPTTILELIGCQMNAKINSWVGFIANILMFIILLIIVKKNKKENFTASKRAIIVYFSVIFIALIITCVLKTSILHYRYLYVITGLYIFSVSNILSKVRNKYIVIIICILVFILSLYNNIKQIKENYDLIYKVQMEYLKEKINKEDTIVYKDIEKGAIYASNFRENKHFFYNPEDWGVVETYKVWKPQLETYIDKTFLDKCSKRIWIIDNENNDLYNELFNNNKYKFISTEKFNMYYKDYNYNITLVENNVYTQKSK